jgi:hypothetical protein
MAREGALFEPRTTAAVRCATIEPPLLFLSNFSSKSHLSSSKEPLLTTEVDRILTMLKISIKNPNLQNFYTYLSLPVFELEAIDFSCFEEGKSTM